ncbi:23S rRNA (uracil(1939)-C(5))-methyltransferase RlmD [Brochothrix campestris]|uniref:RNA methyltransferase n=1 Tax=Brochothrix campestris FSL F6-1037 TaxID=1265861 RepID=W7CR88_9LIST|nr:23S rRNA (uracil(1939)-C(5))-methyltransferase RlmD [Brochothrix campestris]EUJ35483.1 RNA methyltransferase [Brochothrix campestris FSL F6-1037]
MYQALPVHKNEEIDLIVESLSHEGVGVCKVNGYPIFVKSALPGETIKVKITKTLKNYGFGRLQAIITPSPERVTPPCAVYAQCGGCQLQHLSYKGQQEFKQQHVIDVFQRLGHFADVTVLPTKGMDNPWAYRNKSQLPYGEVNGMNRLGFYRERSHDLIATETCLIQNTHNDAAMQAINTILAKHEVFPYNERTNKGTLRHVMLRYGRSTNELMVVLITRTPDMPRRRLIVEEIVAAVPEIVSVYQNVNKLKTNVIFGDQTIHLYGQDTIEDTIHDVKFKISPRSFYQINPEQTEVLYAEALKSAGLTGSENVIDAYCGIGSISLCLAKGAKHVYGVEIVPEAIEDAKENALLNGLTNTTFEAGPAEVVIPNWYKQGVTADVICVDPPRKGCDEKLLNTLLKMKPKRIVYVSCNPATLARDARVLVDGGYTLNEVQPVDMFPQTAHVEAVCSFSL